MVTHVQLGRQPWVWRRTGHSLVVYTWAQGLSDGDEHPIHALLCDKASFTYNEQHRQIHIYFQVNGLIIRCSRRRQTWSPVPPPGELDGAYMSYLILPIGFIGGVLLLPPSAPERSRLVSSRSVSTSERFASRSLTPDETSPSALTLLRPKRATKRRMATPTCLLFCAAFGGNADYSDEMYVYLRFFVHI